MNAAQSYLDRKWYDDEVNKQWKKFTTKQGIKIFVGTWNVNAKPPPPDVKCWLIHKDLPTPDIYILGFQEIVDLNAANVLWIESDSNLEWEECVGTNTLSNDYVKLASRTLVGILLLIYVRKELRRDVKDVLESQLGVGLLGTMGNKGGVGVHFQILDSHICVICSHLAAHKNNVAGRNSDYMKIMENLKFVREKADFDNVHLPIDIILHHDCVIWLGDLNYRLNLTELSAVYDKVEERDWKYLLQHDQLFEERQQRHAFEMFNEHPIEFAPTYKFQPGTSDYERRPEKKVRFPAWCDRVLWRKGGRPTSHPTDVQCLKYGSAPDLQMSDHKPVFAHLVYAANNFDPQKQLEIRREVMKRKDKKENANIPQITIENEISFPIVKYGDPEKRRVPIHNVGVVVAHFEFQTAQEKLPQWLNINPTHGIVAPGEKTYVTFTVSVTASVVRSLADSKPPFKMQETVILSVGDGPQPFITITASYLPSCFGNKIEELIKYRQPIRFVNILTSANSNVSDFNSAASANSAANSASVLASASASASASANNNDNNNNSGDSNVDVLKTKTQQISTDALADGAVNNVDSDIDDTVTVATTTQHPNQVLSIPKELWRLVDHLYKHGMGTESIFITRGIRSEISEIRECLDTGKEFGRYEMHSVGEAFVRFLESLQDPILPQQLCDSFEDNSDITQWCRNLLMCLPLSHYNSFIYIISFLREVLKHTARNHLTADKLAWQFSSALVQTEMKDVRDAKDLQHHKPFKILRHFLTNIESI